MANQPVPEPDKSDRSSEKNCGVDPKVPALENPFATAVEVTAAAKAVEKRIMGEHLTQIQTPGVLAELG